MAMHALQNYLAVGAILFVLGAIGFLTRRNLIVMFLSAEMMLQGVSVNLVAFGKYHGNFQGQAFTIFVLTVAACEAAIAMALIIAIYQRSKTLDVSVWNDLGETPTPSMAEEVAASEKDEPPADLPISFPPLTPSGREPALPERKVYTHA